MKIGRVKIHELIKDVKMARNQYSNMKSYKMTKNKSNFETMKYLTLNSAKTFDITITIITNIIQRMSKRNEKKFHDVNWISHNSRLNFVYVKNKFSALKSIYIKPFLDYITALKSYLSRSLLFHIIQFPQHITPSNTCGPIRKSSKNKILFISSPHYFKRNIF